MRDAAWRQWQRVRDRLADPVFREAGPALAVVGFIFLIQRIGVVGHVACLVAVAALLFSKTGRRAWREARDLHALRAMADYHARLDRCFAEQQALLLELCPSMVVQVTGPASWLGELAPLRAPPRALEFRPSALLEEAEVARRLGHVQHAALLSELACRALPLSQLSNALGRRPLSMPSSELQIAEETTRRIVALSAPQQGAEREALLPSHSERP